MKRIDFFGSPGAGKTTLYKELYKQRKPSNQWLTPVETKIQITKNYLKGNKQIPYYYLNKVIFNFNIFKKIQFLLSEKILNRYQKEILWNSKDLYTKFFEIALMGMNIKEKDPLRRIMGINNFFEIIKEVIIINNHKTTDLIIFDESILQKIYGVTHWKFNYFENIVINYFNSVPVPTLLIYCKLDPKETFNRIKKRKKRIAGHRNVENNELFEIIKAQINIAELGVNILRKKEVKILELNMNNDVNYNIKLINKTIKNII